VTPGEIESSWSRSRARRAGSSAPRRGSLGRSASRASLGALLAIAALAVPTVAPVAQGATPKQIIALLNAQRAANGIPAGVTENSAWTMGCRQHDAYEKLNATLSHEELPGKPGFSPAGNQIAQTSVLSQGISWGPGDPYDKAPFHLFDLLNPRISSTGAADAEGYGCVEIELGTLRAIPSVVRAYSYPGNHRRAVPFSQRSSEQPETPAQTVGLGTRATGPNMFVYFDGPWTNGSRTRLARATISSSRGTVALRWLDNTTSNLLAPTGAILVPAAPLRPATTYRVRVQGSVTGVVPGTSIEEALPSCQAQPAGTVDCGQPPTTACVEDFATLQAVCGLSRTWAVAEDFSFTTARH
jgi:hypothetical protein